MKFNIWQLLSLKICILDWIFKLINLAQGIRIGTWPVPKYDFWDTLVKNWQKLKKNFLVTLFIFKYTQCFLRSFSVTGTWTKSRSRYKTFIDWKGQVNTSLNKVIMSTFLCRYWITWFRSVPVLCRDRHFVLVLVPGLGALVLVPVPLKDRKKRCMTQIKIFDGWRLRMATDGDPENRNLDLDRKSPWLIFYRCRL